MYESRKNVWMIQRLFLGGGFDIRIKVEILNNQNNRSKAQVYGVGENPLN